MPSKRGGLESLDAACIARVASMFTRELSPFYDRHDLLVQVSLGPRALLAPRRQLLQAGFCQFGTLPALETPLAARPRGLAPTGAST